MTGKPLLVILGPTAVGKTGLAVELAQTLKGAIISADSRQTYRYMDIGTAKPTPEQRAAATHHLLDVVEPDETLAVAQYQRMAYHIIDDLHEQGKLPMLVGGTGQYITAVIEGWSFPEVAPNPTLRAELEAFAAEHGAESLYQRLLSVDPEAAEKIHHNNIRRTVRALEVYLETGQAFSELKRKQPPPYRVLQYGLTIGRDPLYTRADQRLDVMLESGFLDEVKSLLERGYERSLPAMSGLGYAQFAAHLDGECSYDEAIAATQTATHHFIKRQFTWFRGHDGGINWLEADQNDPDVVARSVHEWLESEP